MDSEIVTRVALDKVMVELLGDLDDSLRDLPSHPFSALFDTSWSVLELALIPGIFLPANAITNLAIILDRLGPLVELIARNRSPLLESGFLWTLE